MLTVIIINTIIVTLSSIFFITIGTTVKQLLPLDKFQSQYFNVGLNFFVGCTFFVSVWLLIYLWLQSAELSLYAAATAFVIILLYKPPNFKLVTKRTLTIVISVIVLVQIIGFARAFDPMPVYLSEQPELVNPFLGFGTVIHSFRAGNITQFILENDRFPLLSQHSFQGVLASISSFSTFHSTQLSLILWLNTFISFSILLIFGFLQFFLRKNQALLGTLVVILGNTLLSPFYTSITDIDRPTLSTTNYETLFGIATLFIATLVVYFSLNTNNRKIHYLTYFTFFVFGFVWNISSGQMVVVFLLLLVAMVFYHRFSKNETLVALKIGGLLTLGCVVGAVTLGGMFNSGKAEDIQQIPGMMSVVHEDHAPIGLRFPRTSESGVLAPAEIRRIVTQLKLPPELRTQTIIVPLSEPVINTNKSTDQLSITQKVKNHPITHGAAKIIRSIQVVFFPLLGIVLAWYIIRKKLIADLYTDLFKYITSITFVSFMFGWVMTTVFTLYGYYWELSRFLYFGAFMSMLILAISGAILYDKANKLKKTCILSIFIFILLGTSIELIVKSAGDYILTPEMRPEMTGQILSLIPEENRRPMTIGERLEFLVYSNYMFGTEYK